MRKTKTLHLKISLWALALSLILAFGAALPGSAQDETLRLTEHRDFGYSLGNQMAGRFTFTVSGPTDLASATLSIDGREVATVGQPPFDFKLNTSDYSVGNHVVAATGRTTDGRTLQSNNLTVEFVESGRAMQTILPLVVAILAVVAVVSVLTAWLSSRKASSTRTGAQRTYGVAGGAICGRCGRPFPLAIMQANLIGGKLARCPYCGKWQVARRASRQALEAAEAAEVAAARPEVPELSPEEKLRRQVEESRYS